MLRNYGSRLIRNGWVWATSALGFISLLIDIFLQGVFPWILYPIIFGLSIIVGGYLVFKDVLEEKAETEKRLGQQIASLEQQIAALHKMQPIISVELFTNNRIHSKKKVIELSAIPDKLNFKEMVEAKRNELLKEWHNLPQNNKYTSALSMALNSPNPDFEIELEEYLPEYEAYLHKLYDAKTASLAAFFITPIILNEGTSPADNVTITLEMPRDFVPSTESRTLIAKLVHDNNYEELKYELSPPSEPKTTRNRWDIHNYSAMLGLGELLENSTDASDPIIEQTDNGYTISYHIQRLVQHKPEKNLEPFLLWLDDIDVPALWEIPVKIFSASLPKPTTDTIFIQINPKKNLINIFSNSYFPNEKSLPSKTDWRSWMRSSGVILRGRA